VIGVVVSLAIQPSVFAASMKTDVPGQLSQTETFTVGSGFGSSVGVFLERGRAAITCLLAGLK